MTKTIKQLITENEELHSSLADAEETLKAIRSGEVDAIMVSGAKGEQVYSINSAETPYRIFVEEMHAGAVTLSRTGIILYCNQRFAELVDEPIEDVIGSYLISFVAPDNRSKIDYLLAQKPPKKKEVLTICLINSLFLRLAFHHMPDYLEGENCIVIATDISEMKKKENELLELHSLLEEQLDKIKRLRMQLIDKKIDNEAEINTLQKTNKKLVKEITKHKLSEAELKQKLKLKRKKK